MMKLFIRKAIIPEQRSPDYDFIRKTERELRMDNEGFNERFDESLIEDYKTRRNSSNWSTEQRLREVESLSANLTSFRWKMAFVKEESDIESLLRNERNGPGFRAACDGLRSRMMRPRKVL
jgi:hypothetical protein